MRLIENIHEVKCSDPVHVTYCVYVPWKIWEPKFFTHWPMPDPFDLSLGRPTTEIYWDRKRQFGSDYKYHGSFEYRHPCRKCDICIEKKKNHWVSRMITEMVQAPRTWFMTGTLNRRHRKLAGSKIGSIKHIAQEYTKYNKRMKEAGLKFRFVMVTELHKDGTAHVHALYHEVAGEKPLTEKAIRKHWKCGISECHLVHDIQDKAFYMAKYITKDQIMRRQRSSLDYGSEKAFDTPATINAQNVPSEE